MFYNERSQYILSFSTRLKKLLDPRPDHMVKNDPYNIKEKYLTWKEQALTKGVVGVNGANSHTILQYLQDMEQGLNVAVSNKKGGRSHIRLNCIAIRLTHLAKAFEARCNVNLDELNETQLCSFFADMRNGTIKRRDGKQYKAVGDYVKEIKAFWHWHMKVNHKKDIEIKDITQDLDKSHDKPDWVYLTEEQIRKLSSEANYKYEVLIWFLFDTGIRAPTELVNIRISDFHNNFKELNIREEISKTFGRRIKLMLCSEMVKDYVKKNNFSQEDYIFNIDHSSINRYFKRLAKRVLGDKVSPAGQKYSELTMYDFRHNSCCYWLPRYKSESALKYRFGWKKSDKIHYYSELLGMRDTISEDDMLIDITKTEIEQKLQKAEKEKDLMQEQLTSLQMQIAKIGELTKQLYLKIMPEITIVSEIGN